jgi:hypothetical protein
MSHGNNIDEVCRRALERCRLSDTDHSINYSALPENVRVKNALSNRARFDGHRLRRRGYIASVDATSLVSLGKWAGKESRDERLLDDWVRGVLWLPLLVRAYPTNLGWTIDRVLDFDIALFLASQGQGAIALQILEAGDPPATLDNLDLLKKGLFNKRGDHCPVQHARITY